MKHWYSEWKDFFFLWFGQSISQLGSRMTAFALVLWSYERAQTVTSVAVLALCSYLPEMLFTFLGGSVADRVSRKAVMFLSDLTAALGTLALLLAMRADALELWHLYAVNLLVGMTNAFQSPASNAAMSPRGRSPPWPLTILSSVSQAARRARKSGWIASTRRKIYSGVRIMGVPPP